MLTDVPDFVEVRVDSPAETSDHSASLVVLEVYLKNSVDSELVRGDVHGCNWNGIVRFPCSESSLNESLLRAIKDRVPQAELYLPFRTGEKPWFDDRCALANRAKQRAYRV